MHKIRTLRFVAIMVAGLLGVAKLSAADLGLWDFNSGNLSASVGATLGALNYADASATAAGTVFNTTTVLGIPNIGGSPAAVMQFPACNGGMGYSMPTPPANGGGSTVNQYTLILDVLYPAASSGKIRPLLQTSVIGATAEYFVITATDGVGAIVEGPGGVAAGPIGQLQPDTWYRLGLVVSAPNPTKVYTNGVLMGTLASDAVDGAFSLDPSSTALILAVNTNQAAGGYVNSIQLRDVALNGGQMAALGTASAAGIPATIPPVPSYIDSRTPDVGATDVSEEPAITVVLNQGDTTVGIGSIQLKLDGVVVGTTANTGVGQFTTTYTVPPRLDPLSLHTLTLSWTDSVVGAKSSTWTFTVNNYQVVTLPAPFYMENFDELTENATNGVALPPGWTVQNQTTRQTATYDLAVRTSISYEDWILISSNRMYGWSAERTDLPTIILNGVKLTSLVSNNLLWAESDSRTGAAAANGQFQDLYTAPISCLGKTNVYLAFNSVYEQNQDNMNFIEYTVDNGATWLPVLYMFDNNFLAVYGPTVGANTIATTFGTISPSRNWTPDANGVGTNYGSYINAPINNSLIPFVHGYTDDGTTDGKRIEVIRLAAADGQAAVRFRLNDNGTSAWFWGIDNFGLYEITTPSFTLNPVNRTVAGGGTTNFTVLVSSPTAVTYQWQHAGTNISNGGHYSGVNTATLTVSNADPNDAGGYRCKATNASGPTTSATANLTVVTIPVMVTQPDSMVVSDGYPAAFSGLAFGATPLTYEWRLGNTPVGSGTSYSLASAHSANAGNYTLVVNNSYGAVTSRVARLSVVNVPVSSDLVVHLKFDGDYTDSSGHGNNATPIQGPALVAGKLGSALQFTTATGTFPAVTNFATLGYPTDLVFGSSDFSISFWVNYTQQNDDLALLSNSQWDSSGNKGWGIFSQDSGSFRVKVTGTGGTRADTGGIGNIIRGNGWHNIVVTFQQGGAMYTMLDGVLLRTTAWTLTGSVDTAGDTYTRTINVPPDTDFLGSYAVNIGQDGTGWYNDKDGGAITNGMIDDVGIWRRALSSQEALAIYNAGNAGQNLSLVGAPSSLGTLSITYSGGNVNFSWAGGTGIRLQKSTNLTNPLSWGDIGSTLGNSSYSEATTVTPTYYRLYKP